MKGGRPHALSKALVRAAMAQRDTKVSKLCLKPGVTTATIYRYVAPDGSLRDRGRQALVRQTVPRAALNLRLCSVTVGTPIIFVDLHSHERQAFQYDRATLVRAIISR